MKSDIDAKADIVTTPPTLTGPCGRAWEIAPDKLMPPHAGVMTWLVEAPYAHPFWHSYIVGIGGLLPVEGLPDAVLHLPDATHELIVAALDPQYPRQAMLDTGQIAGKILTPLNFSAQAKTTDEEYVAKVRADVQMIIDGQLSPDTDFRQVWIAKYGDSCVKR